MFCKGIAAKKAETLPWPVEKNLNPEAEWRLAVDIGSGNLLRQLHICPRLEYIAAELLFILPLEIGELDNGKEI